MTKQIDAGRDLHETRPTLLTSEQRLKMLSDEAIHDHPDDALSADAQLGDAVSQEPKLILALVGEQEFDQICNDYIEKTRLLAAERRPPQL
jgi:hypothetical protein